MLRQLILQEPAQAAGGGRLCRFRDDVGHQLVLTRHRLPRHDDGLSHSREAEERRLDLGSLDPVASYFDLEVFPSQVLEAAVRVHPTHVAGAKDALGPARRVAQEGRSREVRLAPVAERQVPAPHRDLAGVPGADLSAGVVEQEHLFALDGVAGRDDAGGDRCPLVMEVMPNMAGLGGAHAGVEQAIVGEVLPV